MTPQTNEQFTRFVEEVEPRVSYTLAAAYGVEVGSESTADALAYARIVIPISESDHRYRITLPSGETYVRD